MAVGSGRSERLAASRLTSRCCPFPVRKRCTSAAETLPKATQAAARSEGEPAHRRPLDLDHVRAEVAQHGGAVRPRDDPREVEHPDALEHRAHASLMPGRVASHINSALASGLRPSARISTPEGGSNPRRTWVYVEGCCRPRTWLFELSGSAAR